MKPTNNMLEAAVNKAVEVGLLPKLGDMEEPCTRSWEQIKAVLAAARAEDPEVHEAMRLRDELWKRTQAEWAQEAPEQS
jgi:hypothetical protein